MSDEVAVEVIGVEGAPLVAGELLGTLRSVSERHGAEVQPLEPSLVFGRDHLVSAVEHAIRARSEGRGVSKSLAGEVLLYASGERQMSTALKKLGLRGSVSSAILVILGPCPPDALVKALGWRRRDSLMDPEGKDLSGFGITKEEMSTVPTDRAHELILERVALVDLLK